MKLKFILLCSCMTLACCQNGKESRLEELKELVTEVEKKDSLLTDEEWEEIDKQYKEMTDELQHEYIKEMTEEEKKNMNLLQGIYLGRKLKHEASAIKEKVK